MLHFRWPIAVVILATAALGNSAQESPKSRSKTPQIIDARFVDGSNLKLTMASDAIEIVSPYGRLKVPMDEIKSVEFATRIPADLAARIDAWIADLGNPQFPVREGAGVELGQMKARAYHALVAATKHKDPEIAKRAGELVERIREDVPADQLEFRPHDVIITGHSKISGRIEGAALPASTAQFGDVALKLNDLQTLRFTAEADPVPTQVLADPGSLEGFRDKIGQTLAIRLTGIKNGAVWGTDVYTTDSTLAAAAVHAGAVKVGQTATVRVKLIPSPPGFQGSTRNGVQTNGFGPFNSAFQFVKKVADE